MANEDEIFKKRVRLLFEQDRLIRSHAIYEATAIEGMIETIIAWHFCPDEEKHLSFKALMFVSTEVMLRKKIGILEHLLRNYYKDILEDLPNIINDLNSVRNFRNKFAHHELILDEDKVKKDGISLRSINRNGKVVEEFISSEDADKKIRMAQTTKWYVLYLWLEIQNRATGKDHNQLRFVVELIKSGVWDAAIDNSQQAKEGGVPAEAKIEK